MQTAGKKLNPGIILPWAKTGILVGGLLFREGGESQHPSELVEWKVLATVKQQTKYPQEVLLWEKSTDNNTDWF